MACLALQDQLRLISSSAVELTVDDFFFAIVLAFEAGGFFASRRVTTRAVEDSTLGPLSLQPACAAIGATSSIGGRRWSEEERDDVVDPGLSIFGGVAVPQGC